MSISLPGVQKPWLKDSGGGSEWRPSWKGASWKGGWGGDNWGGKKKGGTSAAQVVPDDFEVDADARYQGVCLDYWKYKGYGWITVDTKGIVPEDKLFCYWKDIVSDDRFPCLTKDLRVEFGLKIVKDNGKRGLRAVNVKLPTGESIALQDEEDAKKKEFVGGQYLRYTGLLLFFSPRRGFGYIKLDDGFALDEDVPKELRVETSEVNSGGKQAEEMKEIQVEFGIWKTPKGSYKAYNMTLPGGLPVTREATENRVLIPGAIYTGTIVTWAWKGEYGWVQAEASAIFPDEVQTKLVAMANATQEKGKTCEGGDKAFYFRRSDCAEGFKPEKGASVSFRIYTDEKGAGACEITPIPVLGSEIPATAAPTDPKLPPTVAA